jgi:hypothetical protein
VHNVFTALNFSLVCTYIFLPFVQLYEACRRGTNPKDRTKSKEANIGGPMILLSIWSWERLPVGRPTLIGLGYDQWDDHNDPDRRPTWAYYWDKVEGFIGSSKTQYLHYCNELDIMAPEHVRSFACPPYCHSVFPKSIQPYGSLYLAQVTWEPYGTAGNIGRVRTFDLNPKCLNEAHLWRMSGPLICYYAVEMHLPHRVMTQFGLYQETPPEFMDTSLYLHG